MPASTVTTSSSYHMAKDETIKTLATKPYHQSLHLCSTVFACITSKLSQEEDRTSKLCRALRCIILLNAKSCLLITCARQRQFSRFAEEGSSVYPSCSFLNIKRRGEKKRRDFGIHMLLTSVSSVSTQICAAVPGTCNSVVGMPGAFLPCEDTSRFCIKLTVTFLARILN